MANDLDKELYNKLWDNINNKDARVWQFISFYGATIGIILGGSATGGFLGLGILLIVIFSFWVLSLIYSSEWWSARNRLMVQAIEDTSKALSDNIPSFYRSGFTTDEVNRVSIMVITFIQLFFMVFLIYSVDGNLFCHNVAADSIYRGICQWSGRYEWVLLVSLKFLFGFLLMWTFTQRQKRVRDYWNLVGDFRKRRHGLAPDLAPDPAAASAPAPAQGQAEAQAQALAQSRYAGHFNIPNNEFRQRRLADGVSYASYSFLTFMLVILISSDLLHDIDIIMPSWGRWLLIGIFAVIGIAIDIVARCVQFNHPKWEVPALLTLELSYMGVAQILFIAVGAVAAVLIS
ncbi:MAG: hypothetical protein QOJ53_310 [Sphingomonadales bacterium]|nr:hypothetical protein [Sphingomonadales bacterium]MEA3045978.1 hypothetical protein [Sphingomonadales bacterium]